MSEDNYGLPEHMVRTLELYRDKGIPTGGFVQAFLSNDLFRAMAKADMNNRHRFYEIASFIYNELPTGCWGSSAKYHNWVANGGLSSIMSKEDEPDPSGKITSINDPGQEGYSE